MAELVLRPPEELLKCLLENDRRPDPTHNLAAIEHRQRLVRFWGITCGARILDVGCGQGDCTVVLADAVGPEGFVVGVDPGPDEFGTPPLGRAHEHVKASVVGKQIEFYLSEPGSLAEIFELTRRHDRAPTVLLADYGSVTSLPAAVPHVLAAVAVNALESFMDPSSSLRNMKFTVTPRQMTAAATKSKWAVRKSDFLVPEPEQRDGWREVVMLLREQFEDDV